MDFGNSNYQSLTNENTTDEGIEELKTDIALLETQIVALDVKDQLSYKIDGSKQMAINYTPTHDEDLVTLKFFWANITIMAYLEVSGNNEMVGSLRFQNSNLPLDVDGIHGISNNNVLSRQNYNTFDYNFYLNNGYYADSGLNDFVSNNSLIISHKDGKITLREAQIDFDNNNVVNVNSLNTITAAEIGTLSGIDTKTTIQTQLDNGMTEIATNRAEILNLQNDKVEKGINNFPQVFSISNQNNIDFTTTSNFEIEAKKIVMIGDTEIKLDSTNSVLVNSSNTVNIKSHDALDVPSGDVILDAKNITIKGDANLGNVAMTGNIIDIIPNELKINTLVGEININSETNTNIDGKSNISLTSGSNILMNSVNTDINCSVNTNIIADDSVTIQANNNNVNIAGTQGVVNIFSENTQMMSASGINLSTSVGPIHIDAKSDIQLTSGNEALLEGEVQVQITSDDSIVLTNKNNNNLTFVTNSIPRDLASVLAYYYINSKFSNVQGNPNLYRHTFIYNTPQLLRLYIARILGNPEYFDPVIGANIGYGTGSNDYGLDLTNILDPSLSETVIKISLSIHMESYLTSTIPDAIFNFRFFDNLGVEDTSKASYPFNVTANRDYAPSPIFWSGSDFYFIKINPTHPYMRVYYQPNTFTSGTNYEMCVNFCLRVERY